MVHLWQKWHCYIWKQGTDEKIISVMENMALSAKPEQEKYQEQEIEVWISKSKI